MTARTPMECLRCGRRGTQNFEQHGDGWVCMNGTACRRRNPRKPPPRPFPTDAAVVC